MGMLAGNGAGAGCCFYAGTVRAGGAECGGKTVQGPGRHYPAHDVEHAVSGEKGAAAGPDADGGRAPRFLESYIAVPVRLVEECPPDYRKVFWLVDAMSKAFLQRMEKEKLAGKELIREYGVYVKACNELLLPVVSRYPLSERFQQVDRELRRQMKAATDREALITALMEQMEDVERSLPPPEKEGAVSPEKKCGEKEE